MKKVVNKNTKEVYSEADMKRYLGALCETHNEHLKGIKEGFIVINRKLDSHSKILDSHSKILDSHSKMLSSHSEMIGSLMENMEIVKGDISIIKADLKKKVDYDDFLSLVRRVQKIESKI